MSEERYCWSDWIPGVLSTSQVEKLVTHGALKHLDPSNYTDDSSVDLVLGAPAYEMTEGAVKPFGDDYEHFLDSSSFVKKMAFTGETILTPERTYVFKVPLELGPSLLDSKRFYGQATGRSSVGRVDVLTRLIVNGMDQYEGFTPDGAERGKNGKLFLEVTPITFRVAVKPGISLSQLRLFLGSPVNARMEASEVCSAALRDFGPANDGYLSLQVVPEKYGTQGLEAVAFRAKIEDARKKNPIKLWKIEDPKDRPKPEDYWTAISAHESLFRNRRFVTIERGYFHILRSKEKLALPCGVAVYCRPSDETIGEMRIHYAGFVHPGFGLSRADGTKGTPLIFEVRGHDFDATLMDGEKLARLEFYRMSMDAKEDKEKSKANNKYENQSLQLSHFFGDWT
jgi:dCTP deaminase